MIWYMILNIGMVFLNPMHISCAIFSFFSILFIEDSKSTFGDYFENFKYESYAKVSMLICIGSFIFISNPSYLILHIFINMAVVFLLFVWK